MPLRRARSCSLQPPASGRALPLLLVAVSLLVARGAFAQIPAAVTDLAAARITTGNDADGTSKILITFTPTAFTAAAEVWRAPFGGYPRYDDAGGLPPPTPSYPPGAPWSLTAVTASGQTDEPATRDAWSYVVFLKNGGGGVSGVSNQTAPAPNYALGDVTNGATPGTGDNLVDDLDISLLGAHYGIAGAAILSAGVSDLDVGPTMDLSVGTRPFTDGRIDFEDLIMFATNYQSVSSPAALVANADAAVAGAGAPERLRVEAPARVQAGGTFEVPVRIDAAGAAQGFSVSLAWNAAVVEPVTTRGSDWVASQRGVAWSARAGTIDAVLLGARARGFAGGGDLGVVRFHAIATGEPAIRIDRVLARDAANRPLAADRLDYGVTPAPLLLAPTPNPMADATQLGFTLAVAGTADLAIYSADGRRVRTLAHGAFAAGTQRCAWRGDDEQHHAAPPGVYFARLVTDGRQSARRIVHLR